MTAKRKPKKAALVLTGDDRAVLSSLPDDERAMVEGMMRRHAGLTAAEARDVRLRSASVLCVVRRCSAMRDSVSCHARRRVLFVSAAATCSFTATKLSGLTDMESIPQRTRNSANSG